MSTSGYFCPNETFKYYRISDEQTKALVGYGKHGVHKESWTGGLLGILPTFFDDKTRESKNSLNDLQHSFGEKVLPPIHSATVLRECWSMGQTIFEYAPQSRASQEYETFASLVRKC